MSLAPIVYKFYLSYSPEDESEFVEPLKKILKKKGHYVWDKDDEITIGDSILDSINHALSRSDYGLVIISPAYLGDKILCEELKAMLSVEKMSGEKVVLPILYKISQFELNKRFPLLSDKLTVSGDLSPKELLRKIMEGVHSPKDRESIQHIHVVNSNSKPGQQKNKRANFLLVILSTLTGLAMVLYSLLSPKLLIPVEESSEINQVPDQTFQDTSLKRLEKVKTQDPEPAYFPLEGRIFDSSYKSGISGVEVSAENIPSSTFTNSSGHFLLRVKGEKGQKVRLFFSKEGYETLILDYYIPKNNIMQALEQISN